LILKHAVKAETSSATRISEYSLQYGIGRVSVVAIEPDRVTVAMDGQTAVLRFRNQ